MTNGFGRYRSLPTKIVNFILYFSFKSIPFLLSLPLVNHPFQPFLKFILSYCTSLFKVKSCCTYSILIIMIVRHSTSFFFFSVMTAHWKCHQPSTDGYWRIGIGIDITVIVDGSKATRVHAYIFHTARRRWHNFIRPSSTTGHHHHL